MSSLDDEETQKRGLATIVYEVGVFDGQKSQFKAVVHSPWVGSSTPVKINSLHYCFKDSAFRAIIDLCMKFFPRDMFARTKLHHGTHLECVYNLMTFGIPHDALCVSVDGDLKRKSHLEWIKMRKRQEFISRDMKRMPLSSYPLRIVVPSNADVLFGRGKPLREHIGNLRLYNLLDENLDRVKGLQSEETIDLIVEMVALIHAKGGRFLMKQDGLCWEEVDDNLTFEKVSATFMTRRRRQKSTNNTFPSIRPTEKALLANDENTDNDAKRARISGH